MQNASLVLFFGGEGSYVGEHLYSQERHAEVFKSEMLQYLQFTSPLPFPIFFLFVCLFNS